MPSKIDNAVNVTVHNPIMQYFEYNHLPEDTNLKRTSIKIYALAHELNNTLPDSAEKSAGLRKLLEAKDCFVRASITTNQ